MVNRKKSEEDVPELYTNDDGEDFFARDEEVNKALQSLSPKERKDVMTTAHIDLVARYALNSLSVTEKQEFDKKYSANKYVKLELNSMYRLIEDEQIDSYGQYKNFFKQDYERRVALKL